MCNYMSINRYWNIYLYICIYAYIYKCVCICICIYYFSMGRLVNGLSRVFFFMGIAGGLNPLNRFYCPPFPSVANVGKHEQPEEST